MTCVTYGPIQFEAARSLLTPVTGPRGPHGLPGVGVNGLRRFGRSRWLVGQSARNTHADIGTIARFIENLLTAQGRQVGVKRLGRLLDRCNVLIGAHLRAVSVRANIALQ